MSSKGNCPNKSSSVFLETSAILNYVKNKIIKKLDKGNNIPLRAEAMKYFVVKCTEKGIEFVSSEKVYEEAKKWKKFFRDELKSKGYHIYKIERILRTSEKKVKKFFSRLDKKTNLQLDRFDEVESFFMKNKSNPKCLKLWEKKSKRRGKILKNPIPEENDIKIFAQAINLPDLYFTSTDGHFSVLSEELEEEFEVDIVTHKNVYQKLREWGWN